MDNNYIRVTEALSPFSGMKNIPKNILQLAGERGAKVHELCDAVMNDIGLSPFEYQYKGYLESFERWSKNKVFIPKINRLYCDKYMLSGEIDGIYEEDGQYILIDIKTSLKENKTWRLQGSAYSYLLRQTGFNIGKIQFIQLDKDGHYPIILEYLEDFDLFIQCLNLYKIFFKDVNYEDVLACI